LHSGYLAPEYATLGQLTPKVDVYSFGILLLEIVSGRKNINSTLASNKIYLVKWALFLYESNMLTDLIEETLDIINSENEVRRVINVALLCVQVEPTVRPLMSHALAMLQGEMEIDINIMERRPHETNQNFQNILNDQSNLPLRENMSINDGNILFTNHVPNSNAEIELSDVEPR
jgi:serine/threonine protein kinase